MGVRAVPVVLFLLCLTSESLQGGLPRLPPNLGKGYSPSSGLGAAFGGEAKPQKPGSPAQNGYGTGIGGGMEPAKPGFGGAVKSQKPGYGPGLGAGAFPGVGAQPGVGMKPQKPAPGPHNGHGPGTGGSMKPPKPGFGNGNGMGAGAFPGVGAQPGLGAGMKPQKAGFGNGADLGTQPGPAVQNGFGAGFGGAGKPQKPGRGNGNGLGAGAFPATGAQPGLGGGLRPRKPGPVPQDGYGPDYKGVKPWKAGLGNGNGFGLGAQPGSPAQNGHGPGTGGSMKPPKPGFGNGNGMGAGAFPGVGSQPGLAAQNGFGAGFGGGGKPQKAEPRTRSTAHRYGNGNGLDARPGPVAQNGYRQGYGAGVKAQKPGFLTGHGLGIQLGYRNGLGPRAFQGQGPRPGLGVGMKSPKTGYNNGNGMAAQPGPCSGGIAPPQLLPRPPTPVPSDGGGGWGQKSQLLPPVQNGKLPALTPPAIQWGRKPQKAGYQPSNGYGAEAELGLRGSLKLQKVGFHYGNGALETRILPETLQSGFPIANGFRNGLREETLRYPKATVPTLERNGHARALQGSPWPAFQAWGAGMKPGYGDAGHGNPAGPYGQPGPDLGLEHFGGPEAKAYTNSQLGNGYRGHCPSGKC